MDSAPRPSAYPKTEYLQYPAAKSLSDRNLALLYLQKRDYTDIIQIGGGGQRVDHFLAMVHDYQRPDFPKPRFWLTKHERIYYLQENSTLRTQTGVNQLLSLFPLNLSPNPKPDIKISSRGLQWPLDNVDWSTEPYSLSNWTDSETIEITQISGSAIVVIPYSAPCGNRD